MGCLVGGKTKECFLLIWNLPTCTPIICQSTKCVCIFRGQVCNWRETETETERQRQRQREKNDSGKLKNPVGS